MRIVVRFDGRYPRRWHRLLLRRLADQSGAEIAIDPRAGGQPMPSGVDMLFQLETLLHGLSRCGPAAALPLSSLDEFRHPSSTPADITLDLCGDVPAEAGRVWKLTFDGATGEPALLALLLAGRTPLVEIVENGAVVAAGRLGTEYGGVALASFEDVLSRTCTLVAAAVRGGTSGSLPSLPAETSPRPVASLDASRLAVIGAKQLARAVVRHLYHLCYHAPHWRTGWRKLDGPDVMEARRHPASGWRDLPDDGRRFYADPFPLDYRGQVTLFVEDYEHRLGKGVISAVAFGPNGPLGCPQPVLEQPVHLSYPFVFERDGQVWMIPESCGAGTVDLFRATAYPGGWVKEATLLSDVIASDATLLEHGGRWWLFATVREGGGAFSDALHLWSAPDFRGPWTAHANNPVLIDIASARPAGRVVRRDGTLLRPVQDCRRGYGAALGLARIERMDDGGFEQSVETILTSGPEWPGRRLHTLNSAGGLEFIDGSALAPRWWRSAAAKTPNPMAGPADARNSGGSALRPLYDRTGTPMRSAQE